MQKMLIADDLEINRKALGSIFCEKYEILEAVNGAEVLEILAQNNIDVLLLDLFMPVMDGFEVLEKIAKSKEYKNLSIIVNTVHGEDENEVRALSLGADEFIFKPYNPNLIAHRVENIVEKNHRLKETEENLRLSNEKAQLEIKINSIIDNVPGGIVTIKRQKDGTRVPMFLSDRYCAIWED
ncbi:MAG: response regulator, partial [Oscillospiraceae bacterium]